MKKLFLYSLLLFLLFTVNNIHSQIKPKNLDATLQLDATTFMVNSLLGGSLDLDVYNFGGKSIRFYTGIRVDYNEYSTYDVGGGERGPYGDYGFLGKFSVSGKLLECNYYLGFSHHRTKEWGIYKTTLEVKLKIYKNFVGLILKPGYVGNGRSGDFTGGIGIFTGISTKDFNF